MQKMFNRESKVSLVEDQSEKARELAKRDAFTRLFAEWLKTLAEDEGAELLQTEDEHRAQGERLEELARLVTTTPAPIPWMIWRKFQVLECYLAYNGEGTTWRDNREIVMLAGIKADLIRFGIGRDD
jgi:hypothetical protein